MPNTGEREFPNEWEISNIISAKIVQCGGRRCWVYEVHWKGFSVDQNTYEPISSFTGHGFTSVQFITDFWASQGFSEVPSVKSYGIGAEIMRMGPPKHLKKLKAAAST